MPLRAQTLADARVLQATARAYCREVEALVSWGRFQRRSGEAYECFDDLVSDYMGSLFDRGLGPSKAEKLMCGLDFLRPGLRADLPFAAASLRGFQRLCVSTPRAAISWPLAVLIALRIAQSSDHPDLGVAVLWQHAAFMRPAEVMGVLPEDAAFPGDLRLDAGFLDCAARLRRT